MNNEIEINKYNQKAILLTTELLFAMKIESSAKFESKTPNEWYLNSPNGKIELEINVEDGT